MGDSQAGMALSFANARDVLRSAIGERAFPSAVVEVGTDSRPIWQEAFGTLTYDAAAAPAALDTIYDLASLTKVLSTTPLIMRAIERGSVALADRIVTRFPEWTGEARADVTVRDLLAHCSGLPGHRPYFRELRGRREYASAICREALEYEPRRRSIYSDLGFMLLGFILEDGRALDDQFDTFKQQTGSAQDLQFQPPAIWHRRTAPTHLDPWRGRMLTGEVDDENAWALGGVAGHAGLFGTAMAVGEQARHLLQVLSGRTGAYRAETAAQFITRTADVPGSSRALGWDTMLPTSSCGTRMSPAAFGHTGFTGTSLWIDPERRLYFVLLTNRVHPTRENAAINRVRAAFHDAVMSEIASQT